MGLSEMKLGEKKIGEMRLGEMLPNLRLTEADLLFAPRGARWCLHDGFSWGGGSDPSPGK